jgi:hypothetical protein
MFHHRTLRIAGFAAAAFGLFAATASVIGGAQSQGTPAVLLVTNAADNALALGLSPDAVRAAFSIGREARSAIAQSAIPAMCASTNSYARSPMGVPMA